MGDDLNITLCGNDTLKSIFTGDDNVLAAMPEKDYRALLTEREREILTGEADVEDSYRYRVVSRIRQKIERLEEDATILRENHDGLHQELQEAVCEPTE